MPWTFPCCAGIMVHLRSWVITLWGSCLMKRYWCICAKDLSHGNTIMLPHICLFISKESCCPQAKGVIVADEDFVDYLLIRRTFRKICWYYLLIWIEFSRSHNLFIKKLFKKYHEYFLSVQIGRDLLFMDKILYELRRYHWSLRERV